MIELILETGSFEILDSILASNKFLKQEDAFRIANRAVQQSRDDQLIGRLLWPYIINAYVLLQVCNHGHFHLLRFLGQWWKLVEPEIDGRVARGAIYDPITGELNATACKYKVRTSKALYVKAVFSILGMLRASLDSSRLDMTALLIDPNDTFFHHLTTLQMFNAFFEVLLFLQNAGESQRWLATIRAFFSELDNSSGYGAAVLQHDRLSRLKGYAQARAVFYGIYHLTWGTELRIPPEICRYIALLTMQLDFKGQMLPTNRKPETSRNASQGPLSVT